MTADEQELRPDGSDRISVECLSCGRRSVLADEAVGGLALVQLTRRLRCSECGSRAVKAARERIPRDVAVLVRSRMRAARSRT